MARNYPECKWDLTQLFLNTSAMYYNTTTDVVEQEFLKEYGDCEYIVYDYITDIFAYSLIACYCIIIPIGFFGNLAVIFTVLSVPELKNVINLLLVGLASSDLLLSVLLPWTLLHNISYEYNYGTVLCKIVPPMQGTAVMSAIVTMVMIAIERYFAILYPFRERILNSPLRVKLCIVLIWILSLCFQIPQPIVLDVKTIEESVVVVPLAISYNVTAHFCMETWSSETAKSYSYAILVMFYIIPLSSLTFLYSRIGYRMWKRRPVGGASYNEKQSYKRKRRLIIFLIILVATFAVLWGPYFIIQCIQGYLKEDYNPRVASYLQMLGHLNVAADPILYALFHQKIRRQMHIYLRKVRSFCCSLARTDHSSAVVVIEHLSPASSSRDGIPGGPPVTGVPAPGEVIGLPVHSPELITFSSEKKDRNGASYDDLVFRLSEIQNKCRIHAPTAESEDSGCEDQDT